MDNSPIVTFRVPVSRPPSPVPRSLHFFLITEIKCNKMQQWQNLEKWPFKGLYVRGVIYRVAPKTRGRASWGPGMAIDPKSRGHFWLFRTRFSPFSPLFPAPVLISFFAIHFYAFCCIVMARNLSARANSWHEFRPNGAELPSWQPLSSTMKVLNRCGIFLQIQHLMLFL